MKRALPQVPVVGERNPKSVRDILMPSTLPPTIPNSSEAGVKKCGKTCIICRQHLVEGSHFHSAVTGEKFTIRQQMTCDTSNIIYLLYCARCDKSQYVGETQNTLKTRFYLHRSHISHNKGTHVTRHFNTGKCTLLDMRCKPIEKEFSDDPHRRLQREEFWKGKLHTAFPEGLNTL